MDYGGEKAERIEAFSEFNLNELNSKNIYVKSTDSSFNENNKIKKLEFNKLDHLVTKDAMELANDIHKERKKKFVRVVN